VRLGMAMQAFRDWEGGAGGPAWVAKTGGGKHAARDLMVVFTSAAKGAARPVLSLSARRLG
jgi:hypothetical protein